MTDNKLQFVLSQSTSLLIGIIIASVFHRWYYHRILVSRGAKKEVPLTVFVSVIIGLTACLSALFSASVALGKSEQDKRIEALTESNHDLGISNRNLGIANRKLATCINDALGDRVKVSDTPAITELGTATRDWAGSILGLFSLPKNPTPAQQVAEGKAIQKATVDYFSHVAHAVQVLDSNAAYRAAHPLGKC